MREEEHRSRIFAKSMRSRLTGAETVLWSKLRRAREIGYRFRRQHPIGHYIADFACIRARLVIEIDGATHGSDEERAYDRRRESFLKGCGWRVLSFQNHEVYEHLHEVLETIYREVPPPPHATSSRSAPPP